MNNDSSGDLPRGSQRIEVITSVQRRRRWASAEKKAMVEETYEPADLSVLMGSTPGKFQPNSTNALQVPAFKIPKGRSRIRSLRPDDNAE
jgi:hypothetical protein